MRAAKTTDDAANGMLAVSALICGFVLFGLYMREQIKITSTVVSSIRDTSAKHITDKPAPANAEHSRAATLEIANLARQAKKGARRRPVIITQRAYPGYAAP
jgi:hypothetical protein